MKVAVLTDLKTISLQERAIPEIGPGEALVKVEYCGICGSDVHAYSNGVAMQVGTVMGHECSGVVARAGTEVRGIQEGDRVWVRPGASCGECYWCRKGQYMRCHEAFDRAIGLTPKCDGAFAEYVKVRYPEKMLFKLPSQVSFEEAALVEPLSVALHGVRMSRLKTGDNVVIIGAGMIGLGVLQFVRIGGAGRIVVLEKSAERSEIARSMGADVVLSPSPEGDVAKRIFDETGGIGADVAFECAGVAQALDSIVDSVSSGGQIMVLGLHEKKVPFDFWQVLHREVELKGSLGFLDECQQVLGFLAGGRIATGSLISDVIGLEELEERGLKRLISSQSEVKILVRP